MAAGSDGRHVAAAARSRAAAHVCDAGAAARSAGCRAPHRRRRRPAPPRSGYRAVPQRNCHKDLRMRAGIDTLINGATTAELPLGSKDESVEVIELTCKFCRNELYRVRIPQFLYATSLAALLMAVLHI